MKKKSTKWIASLMFASIAFLSFTSEDIEVDAATNIFGCTASNERKADINTTEKLKAYLNLINVPYEKYVTKPNKVLTINKEFLQSKCIIVYGTPANYVNEARRNQEYKDGQYKYLGYDLKGNGYPNPDFPDVSSNPAYMMVMDFVKYPWNNTALKNDILYKSTIKPMVLAPNQQVKPSYNNPKTGRVATVAEELDRSIDRMYLTYCGNACGYGERGYFIFKNNFSGTPMTGAYLKDYVSIEAFPGAYTAGVWNIYRVTSSGQFYFSTNFMRPYKMALAESKDLSVEITSINPSPVNEEGTFIVNYKLCNLGELSVKNPVIHYGITNATKSQTINLQLGESQCYSGSINETAPTVSSDTDKTFKIEVNKSRNNPTYESNWSNNVSQKNFKVINKYMDGSISINSWHRTYPHSNEYITVNYSITNAGNTPVYGVLYNIGFEDEKVVRRIQKLDEFETGYYSITVKTPEVLNYEGYEAIQAQILSGFSGDANLNDNISSKKVTVRNPDAAVEIIVENDSRNNTIGNVNVKVTNNTFTTIAQNCFTSALKCYDPDTSTPDYFRINIYDTNFTESRSDDTLIGVTRFPTYSINHGDSKLFSIPREVFTDYIEDNYPDTYQLLQFRIVAQIPYYNTEVDWQGEHSYANNTDNAYFNYFPERPSIVTANCNVYEHNYNSYFNTSNGGVNPIKMCAGHFPTYPSTKIENGMQAYHYVLYRFFPQPMPKYTVITPEINESSPNHFSQLYTLPTTENRNTEGDFESMFFPNKITNGYYQERGRYLPVGGTFDFEVYHKETDGKKGDVIALGTVSYNIPENCYNITYLDMKHQYGCDEIMFFLPNADTLAKYEKPSDYSFNTISYPIANSKIPYLNPGEYTFEFKADEKFVYYYQQNLAKSGYGWSAPKSSLSP